MKDTDPDGFIEEYEKLCEKYGLYIDIQQDDTLAVFPIKTHHELRLEELRNAD